LFRGNNEADGNRIRLSRLSIDEFRMLVIRDESPRTRVARSDAGPQAQRSIPFTELDGTSGVAMTTFDCWRLAILFHAKYGTALAKPYRLPTADALVKNLGLVHVSEEMSNEPAGRRNFGIAFFLAGCRQPVGPLMGEQETNVMLLYPIVYRFAGGSVDLPDIPNEPPFVIAALELKKSCIQSDNTNPFVSAGERVGEISWKDPIGYS